MSTEKLSELSKPVAWTSARSLEVRRKITAFTDVESAAEYSVANCWEKIVPLYSQEYVSALLAELEFEKQNNAGVAGMVEDYETKLEAKDEVLREIAFHVSAGGYNADSVDAEVFKQKIIDGINSISGVLIKRIDELEAKLATPVRLPNKNDDEFWFDNVFQVAKFDRAVERAIRAAGFKFVGDE